MKKFLSLVLALVMTMSLVTISAGAKDFTDDSKITYKEAVDVLSAVKVIDGYTDGSFNPSATLTRGAAAKIICNLILGPTTASALSADAAPYKDVPADSTFAGYIAYCAKAGIISGYADGTFKPGATLTTYAYMKMLLGALGYDSDVEGYAGSNWSINVAKQALNIGLDKGLKDDLNGIKPVTREEACLYALNTLKADLVEYDAKTSINVGGAEVVIAGSKAQAVTSTKDSNTIKNETEGNPTLNNPDVVQFAEKYFPKLSLTRSDDDFMRPSNLWKLKGVKIGNYAKTPDLTYTKKTKSDTIYDDLGLSETIVATTYVDGANQGTFTVKNGDTDTKIGKQGVLTEVFKTETASKVYLTITQVNTYVGDVTAKVAATKTKDAYVSVAPRLDGAKGGNFDTTEFALDDVVLYTYSNKAGSEGVKSVVAAEIVPGTLTGFTIGDSATVGGTKYDYAAKVANEAGQADINTEVKVVLDTYGNAIDIDGAKDANYAVVLDRSTTGLHKEVELLFTDGTVKTVATDRHYTNGGESIGDIVSYIIKTGEKYQLTQKAADASGNVAITNSAYGFTTDATYTANGKTIFLVKTVDANGDAMYKAYEGIKNVPTISTTASLCTTYCKVSGNLATVVYVDASTGSVLDPTSDVIFVKGTDDVSYTSGVGSYYKYSTALVNGEKPEDDVKATTHVADDTYAMFDGVSYDANGVVTMTASDNVIVGTGVYKQANEVLGTSNVDIIGDQGHTSNATNGASVNRYAYYPVAKDLKVAIIDEDGDLTTGYTINSVAKDSNDVIYFKLNTSNEITYAVIMKVAGNVQVADQYDLTITGNNGFTYVIKKGDTTVKSGSDTSSDGTETVTLDKGTYTVAVTDAGVTTTKTVVLDESITVPFAPAATYTLTVSDSNNFSGAISAKLTVKDSNGNVVATDTSVSASDTFTLADGFYTVTFSADNYQPITKTVVINGANAPVDMDAGVTYRTATFKGMQAGVKVDLTSTKGNLSKTSTGTTDMVFYLLDGATYTYTISGTGVLPGQTDTITVDGANADDVTAQVYVLSLAVAKGTAAGTIKATITDSNGVLGATDHAKIVVEVKLASGWAELDSVAAQALSGLDFTTANTVPAGVPVLARATADITLADGTVLNQLTTNMEGTIVTPN